VAAEASTHVISVCDPEIPVASKTSFPSVVKYDAGFDESVVDEPLLGL